MVTFVEPLFKAFDKILFGWSPEPITGVQSYNLYVGQVPGTLTKLVSGIGTKVSNDTPAVGKISYTATIASVQTALSIPSTFDFSNLLLYWAITYVSGGVESSITASKVIEVPPVGILGKTKKEDPSTNRDIFGFSDQLQRWIKLAASSNGALIVDTSDYYQANITNVYTYDGTNVATELSYFSDRTTSGSPAKLITYTYTGSNLTKKAITDSTVP